MKSTIPFRPYIFKELDFADDETEMYLDTGLVVVAPDRSYTPGEFGGADKVEFNLAKPGDLRKTFWVRGEFISGEGDLSKVSIAIYAINQISEQLQGMYVTLPLEFIGKICTKCVPHQA